MTKEEFYNKYHNGIEMCPICQKYIDWSDLEDRNFEGTFSKGIVKFYHIKCIRKGEK